MTEPIEDVTMTAIRERRRRASGVLVGVATLALVAAACQGAPAGAGDDTTEPTVTEEPTETETAEEPTDEPTEDDGGGEDTGGGTDAGLPDFSDAVFPECGDAFDGLPERTSDLVVEGGPSEALPEYSGGWMATVTNNGDELVQGQIGMMQLIVVDGDGNVVAAPDPDDQIFYGAEGPFWMGIAPGETLETGIPMTHGCETGDWLPAGDYQAYAAITFTNSEGDFGEMEQAQGGPWDITVGGGESDITPIVPPGTAVANLECGQEWTNPDVSTGYELELLDEIRSPRAGSDPIEGRASLTTGGPVDALVFTTVLVLMDGEIVNWEPGSDTATTVSATAGATVPLDFGSELFSCGSENSPEPLARGVYDVVVVAVALDGEGTHVLDATDPVTLDLS